VQVVFLLGLQVTSFVVLWAMTPLTQPATDTFALYLSLNLLAFVILSYIYRMRRMSRNPNTALIATGYLVLIVLLVSNLILA
jgi:hypothetical protein